MYKFFQLPVIGSVFILSVGLIGHSQLTAAEEGGLVGGNPNPAKQRSSMPVLPPPFADLLVRAHTTTAQFSTELANFICTEKIERYKGRISDDKRRPVDIVTSVVSYENGIEHYTDIHQDSKPRRSIADIAGAWSEGEYGTLLIQARNILNTHDVRLRGIGLLDGKPAALYIYDIDESESPWDLVVNGRHYATAFHGEIWVSRENSQILRVTRTSLRIPPATGITQVCWSANYDFTDLNGKKVLLPKTAEYSVAYVGSDRLEWNVMTFSNYKRYGSDVSIHYQ